MIGKLFGECVLHGAGVGVVISPRDLSRERAVELAPQYRDLHADVMIDPQLYLPDSTVGRISAYAELVPFRQAVSQLHKIPDAQLVALQAAIHQLNDDLGQSAQK